LLARLATPLGGSLGEMLVTPRGSREGVLASEVCSFPFRPSWYPLASVSLSQPVRLFLRRRARLLAAQAVLLFVAS